MKLYEPKEFDYSVPWLIESGTNASIMPTIKPIEYDNGLQIVEYRYKEFTHNGVHNHRKVLTLHTLFYWYVYSGGRGISILNLSKLMNGFISYGELRYLLCRLNQPGWEFVTRSGIVPGVLYQITQKGINYQGKHLDRDLDTLRAELELDITMIEDRIDKYLAKNSKHPFN